MPEHARALHADEHPHHDHEAVDNLGAHASGGIGAAKVVGEGSPEIGGEDIEAEHEQHRDDEHEDGDELADHHDGVYHGSLFDAMIHQEHDEPVHHGDEHHSAHG